MNVKGETSVDVLDIGMQNDVRGIEHLFGVLKKKSRESTFSKELPKTATFLTSSHNNESTSKHV